MGKQKNPSINDNCSLYYAVSQIFERLVSSCGQVMIGLCEKLSTVGIMFDR
jgi:hypothetical protein